MYSIYKIINKSNKNIAYKKQTNNNKQNKAEQTATQNNKINIE